MIVFAAALATTLSIPGQAHMLLLAVILFGLAMISGVLKLFVRRMLFLLPMILFIGIFAMLRSGEGEALLRLWGITLTSDTLTAGISLQLRLLLVAMTSTLFIIHIPSRDIVAAMHSLRMPSRIIATAWLTERFLALLSADVQRQWAAVRARSATLTRVHRIKLATMLTETFILRAVGRSDRMADAMIARGFDGRIPIHSSLRWTIRDTVITLTGTVVLLVFWIC